MYINPIPIWRQLEANGARQHFGEWVRTFYNSDSELQFDLQCRCVLGWLAGEETDGSDCSKKMLGDGYDLSLRRGLAHNRYGMLGYTLGHLLDENQTTLCPVCQGIQPLGPGLLMHLNDNHYWSFGKIADFAETNPEIIFNDVARMEFGL